MFEVEKVVDLAIGVGVSAAHEAVPDDADVEFFHRENLARESAKPFAAASLN
jgi:hypothetical protein